jgi:LuxR family transcriptional regulator, maltose regulon positive regulatory protein
MDAYTDTFEADRRAVGRHPSKVANQGAQAVRTIALPVPPAYELASPISGGEGGQDVEAAFPFTKFLPPQLDGRVVVGRILEVMCKAVAEHALTVVVAPAGSGKTTALATWEREAAEPVAWVRIGPHDDSPTAIAAALLAGIRRVVHRFGPRLAALLGTTGTASSTHNLITALTNDLGEIERITVVLDDAHELTAPETWAFVDGLLEHLPGTARLVVAGRTEPSVSLSRRRVRGEVAEIGLDDLRLTPDEVREVLAGEAGDAVVDAVIRASGGWAAAVRLTTARLRTTPHAASARSSTAAASPEMDAVSSARPDLWRFLAEEVLDSQPPDLRSFLIETAILDELTPEVCAAVTGRPEARDVLDELDRRSLFVARFASERGPAWRYHDLFAAFLRERLSAERTSDAVVELHLLAADALPPAQAVPHLLAAGQHDRVAQIALGVTFERLDPGVLSLIVPWVEALPHEVVERHPRLALVLTWRDEMTGRHTEILTKLEPLHARLRDAGRDIAAAEIGLEIAVACLMSGDYGRAGRLVDEAIGLPLDDWARLMAHVLHIHVSREQGDWAGASLSLGSAFDLVLGPRATAPVEVLASGMSANLLFADQGPAWVIDRAQQLRGRLDPSEAALSLAGLRPLLAGAALLRLDLDRATDELRLCLTASREVGGLAWTQQEAEMLQLALHLGTGKHGAVRRVVDEAYTRMSRSPIDASMLYAYAHADARSAWCRGDRRRLAATVGRLAGGKRPEEDLVRAVAQAMVARMDERGLDQALDELAEAERAQRELRAWFGAGLPGLERAAILYERGRTRHALEAAEPTLAKAAELGAGILLADASSHEPLLRRCVTEGLHAGTVGAVLAALDRPPGAAASAVPGTTETVSAREVEVLAHVAQGLSNRDIATELFISEVTVKSHLTRIFRKLDASSRTQAVARARELHLL